MIGGSGIAVNAYKSKEMHFSSARGEEINESFLVLRWQKKKKPTLIHFKMKDPF